MRLPKRIRRRRRDRVNRLAEAEAAVTRARKAQQEAKERRPEVHAVVARLKQLREENHFAEAIERAMRGA